MNSPQSIKVSANPLPWLTPRLARAGAFKVDAYGKPTAEALLAARNSMQAVVDGLHDAQPYTLAWGAGVASTTYQDRTVRLGAKIMSEPGLTDGQRAAIMLGAVYHEIGHIRFTKPLDEAVQTTFVGNAFASHIGNIAGDLMLEDEMRRVYRGYAESLESTLWWAGGKGERKPGAPALATRDQRLNEGFAFIRYPWVRDWSRWPHLAAWLDEWRAWGERAAKATTVEAHLRVVREAIDLAGQEPPPAPAPEPEPEPEPKKGEGKDEGKGEDESEPDESTDEGDEGEDESTGSSDEGDEDEDGDGEGDSSTPPTSDTESDEGEDGESEGDDERHDSDEDAKAGQPNEQGEGESGEPEGEPDDEPTPLDEIGCTSEATLDQHADRLADALTTNLERRQKQSRNRASYSYYNGDERQTQIVTDISEED